MCNGEDHTDCRAFLVTTELNHVIDVVAHLQCWQNVAEIVIKAISHFECCWLFWFTLNILEAIKTQLVFVNYDMTQLTTWV